MLWKTALRTWGALNTGDVLFSVNREIAGVELRRISIPGMSCTWTSRSWVLTLVASIWPLRNALILADASIARNVRLSSLPGSPHQFGLRVKEIVPVCWSNRSTTYGPAPHSGCGVLMYPWLNTSGASAAGCSTLLNRPSHQTFTPSNVTTACRSSTPGVTEVMRSYPSVEFTRYTGFRPLFVVQTASNTRQSMGVPSLNRAAGLIV